MKKIVLIMTIAVGAVASNSLIAQKVKTVKLEQTPGEFTVKGITLTEGNYVFEITNNGVDHPVGFGLATKQKPTVEDALAVVTNGGRGLDDGESDKTDIIALKKGEYVYWCPANPTEQYQLIVE